MATILAVHPGMLQGNGESARSLLTFAIFGIPAGYHVTFAIGLLRRRSRVLSKVTSGENRLSEG